MIDIENLLAVKYPVLLELWDYEKNDHDNINVNTVTCGSNIEAWWKCSRYNHSYKMKVNKRVSYDYDCCPYCSGHRVLHGFNDLQSTYSKLVDSEWDYEKNDKIGLKPDEITSHSSIKAWWHCVVCGGSYEMRIIDKTSGHQGCPFCAGKRVLTGFNDLQSCYHELVNSEWDYEKNNILHINPNMLTCNSSVKAWWKCSRCHGEYKMPIYKRTGKNSQGCPFCAGNKVLKGFNDLQSCYPDIAKEWYQPLNGSITPDMVTKGSNIIRIPDPKHPNKTISVKPAWKCRKCRHIWRATVNNRTRSTIKSRCPACAHRVSKQENQVADYIDSYLCKHYNNMNYTILRSIKFKKIYKMLSIDTNSILSDDLQSHLLKELDIYIPELNLAVEYDGDYWHNDAIMLATRGLTNNELHEIKKALCKQAGIELIFITEHEWLHDTENVKVMIKNIIMRIINHMK